MARNIELYPALPISSTSIQRNHEHGNTDTAKSDLSLSELFGSTNYWSPSGGVTLGGEAETGKSTAYTASVSGGVDLGGSAAIEYVVGGEVYEYVSDGGTVLSGQATAQYVSAAQPEPQPEATGGGGYIVNRPRRIPTFRGVELPDPWKRYSYTGSGGPRLGGSAAVSHRKVFGWFGTGKMALGGEAKAYKPKRIRFTGSGGPRIDGKSFSFMFSPVLDEQEALELLVLD